MPLLEIRNLKKSYRSPDGNIRPVLDVPTFVVEAEEQVALRGASGTGKTTLLNLIAGILRPDSGNVLLDGVDLAGLSEARRDALRATLIGYVFQTFNLLQGYTALENVLLGMMFGPGADRPYARNLLTELGLGDRLDYRPGQLSVGQQQRVALARALANRPRLVLADEPTGNLDSERAAEALELLCKACRDHGAALLIVSHDLSVLQRFERSIELAEINIV
ncbi:MAG: ABC transporter ATP-binding protein [Planctomycetota bacterium]|nr:ABC transporter ATP-binding protein [Planctomycetota bacterium]